VTDKPLVQLDALTSLRFFAAFYVLVYHSGGPALVASGRLPEFAVNFLSNGYLGVQFFFVLSGFILTYVYYGKIHSAADAANFGWARFARVYPVYALALVLALPFSSAWQAWEGLPQVFLLQSWSPVYLFTENWIVNSNGPAWTLSVELFFYLTFPWLVRWIAGLETRAVIGIAVLMAAIMLGLRTASVSDIRHILFDELGSIPLPILRFPEFVYGVALGVLLLRGAIPRSPATLIVLAVGMLATIVVSRSLWVAPIAAILAGVIIAMVPHSLGNGLASRFLTSPKMVLLGGASYSLYLLQAPVGWWMKWLAPAGMEIYARVLYLPTIVLLSIPVFLYFEEPMRRALRNGARPPKKIAS
jgi:peptidoglycan/LPS O-acetylase OafA/YrhL